MSEKSAEKIVECWGSVVFEALVRDVMLSVGDFYSYGKIAAARYGFGQGHES